MEKNVAFILFTFFNVLFALTGLGSIIGAIFLMIKSGYNSLYAAMILFGVIIIGIFAFGLKTKNKYKLLLIYLIFVIIILIFDIVLSLFIMEFNDKLTNFLKLKSLVLKEDELNKIKEYKIYLFLITLAFAILSLLAFIGGIFYYKKLRTKDVESKKKEEQGDDILKGLDYSTSLMPDK